MGLFYLADNKIGQGIIKIQKSQSKRFHQLKLSKKRSDILSVPYEVIASALWMQNNSFFT